MPSAVASYPGRVVARFGIEANAAAALTIVAETGFDVDTKTFRVADGTATPCKIPTNKSTGVFDFTSITKWTMPGGLVFDTAQPGKLGGVPLADLNKTNGLLARRGDGQFGSAALASTDSTLLIGSPQGESNQINLRINPDSDVLKALVQSIVSSAINNFKTSIYYTGSIAPRDPTLGMHWFDPDEGVLYVYVTDGTTPSWLEVNG